MEVNDPAGDQNNRWFVTSGRLVVELITGSIQTGQTSAEQRYPADIPIAGDATDPDGPTYASFGGVTSLPAQKRLGKLPREQLTRAGRIQLLDDTAQYPETKMAHFVDETQHNIPQVFWDYFTATKLDWVYVLGYPLSEPYWAHSKINGIDMVVLIQPFERRVLTYVPGYKSGAKVEMGNVGRHYYQWRYGEPPPN